MKRRRSRSLAKKSAVCAAAGSLVGVGSVATTPDPPAAEAAVSFNRNGAVAHAGYWWNSSPPDDRFRPFGSDCTNFASYIWHLGGGTWMNSAWYIEPGFLWGRNYTPSWTVVQDFVYYHTHDHYEGGGHYATGSPSNKASDYNGPGAAPGDVIMYNWNDGGSTYDHLGVDIGAGYIGTYYDYNEPGYNYVYYTLNRGMTIMAQHTSNRYGAPWNFGYLRMKYFLNNAGVADGMYFKNIHVNT